MADLGSSLKKLDRLTQEEARMALAEVLRITHNVCGEVKVVDGKVESVEDKVDDMADKVENIGDKVQCVDERVQVIIDGTWCVSTHLLIPSNAVTFRWKGSKSDSSGSKIDYSTDGQPDRRSQVFVTSLILLLLVTYAYTRREPVKAALTSVDLSRRSVYKPQHCPKSSIQGNGSLVLSRQYHRRMEVHWLPLVGPWKTCVPFTNFWARAF